MEDSLSISIVKCKMYLIRFNLVRAEKGISIIERNHLFINEFISVVNQTQTNQVISFKHIFKLHSFASTLQCNGTKQL